MNGIIDPNTNFQKLPSAKWLFSKNFVLMPKTFMSWKSVWIDSKSRFEIWKLNINLSDWVKIRNKKSKSWAPVTNYITRD